MHLTTVAQIDGHMNETIYAKKMRPSIKPPVIPQAEEIFTIEEIAEAIQETKNNRTPGPDGSEMSI